MPVSEVFLIRRKMAKVAFLAFYCQEEGQKLLCHIKCLFLHPIFWFQLLNFLRLFHIAVHMLSCKLQLKILKMSL